MTAATRTCSVTACENSACARGFCDKHYRRFRKHGDPLKLESPEERRLKSQAAARNFMTRRTDEERADASRKRVATMKRKRATVLCKRCDGVVADTETENYSDRRKRVYCSRDCFAAAQGERRRQRGARTLESAGAALTEAGYAAPRKCAQCCGLIRVGRAREVENKRFCSVKCRAVWQSELPYGMWRGKIAKNTKNRPRGSANHMWGKTPPHGKCVQYVASDGETYVFRSTWEREYATYLDTVGEPWQYEAKKFVFPDCTYTPDFFLPRRGHYVEVKGWMSERSRRQIAAFRKHADTPLVVIGANMYKGVQNSIGAIT